VALSRRGNDVFVVGGGPAGLAAAIAAQRKGFSVTVADGAEPLIDKACGEGLLPGAQTALAELGIQLSASHGFRFKGISFIQDNAQVSADFQDGMAIGIRRTQLHELLINEAEKSGVRLLWKTAVKGIDLDGVHLNSRTVKAGWIIGADGSHSRVRQWAKLDDSLLYSRRFGCRRHFRMRPWSDYMQVHWGPAIQAYVTPISGEEVCIVAMGETPCEADFDAVMQHMPELQTRLKNAQLTSRERGATTAMHKLRRVWRGNVALVGDASGGVDAITGEGLRLAFRQANVLAQALSVGDLRTYAQFHRKLAKRPLQMGKLMLTLGRHDKLRSRAFGLLGRRPDLFTHLLDAHVERTPARGAVSTGVQLGWQLLLGSGRAKG
jgi:menaquinone-9 beta-reductase